MTKKNQNLYFTIYNWMNTLNFNAAELIVYAFIYSHSKKTNGEYSGTLNYMASRTNYNKITLCRTLKKLVNNNFLTKKIITVNGKKYVTYKHNQKKLEEMNINTSQSPTYYIIYHWMINTFKLNGNELLMYAIIYSYTESSSGFIGSVQYFTNKIHIGKTTAYKNLNNLVENGYVIKNDVESTLPKKMIHLRARNYKEYETYIKYITEDNDCDCDNWNNSNEIYDDISCSAYYPHDITHETNIPQSNEVKIHNNLPAEGKTFLEYSEVLSEIAKSYKVIIEEHAKITQSILECIQILNDITNQK